MKTFGISTEDGEKIIYRVVIYWCHNIKNCSEVVGGKYSDPLVVYLLGNGLSARATNSL